MRPASVLIALLFAPGCKPTASAEDSARLVHGVRGGLAQREAKLRSFALKGRTTEGERSVRYAFAYRAPNRMRAVFFGDNARTLTFDGETLYEASPGTRRVFRYRFDVPHQQASLFLNEVFAPLVPEGFRTPVIARENVTAARTTHPRAPDAVRITQTVTAADQAPSELVTVLRAGSLDFLGKKGPGGEIVVEAEHCDEKLAICVPRKLRQSFGAEGTAAVTELTEIDLQAPLSADAFAFHLEEGFTLEEKTISAP